MPTHKTSLTIAVFGATGTQGGAVINALVKHGYVVRALTRSVNSNAAQILQDRGIEVTYADLADSMSLKKAFVGVGAIFLVTTPFGTSPEAEAHYGKNAIDAAIKAQVKHLVFTSAANANRNTGVPHFDSKYKIEQYLVASGLPWTILGPGAFMDDFAHGWYKSSLDQGKLTMVMQPNQRLQFICSEDIAAMAALAIDQPERFIGKRVDIASDAATGQEIAALFSQAYDRSITFESVPLEIAETYSHDLAAMFRYFQETGLAIDTPGLHTTYPEVRWHTFADWVTQHTLA
jgi:uncharacterized protein YbjT (DUF2867 family)